MKPKIKNMQHKRPLTSNKFNRTIKKQGTPSLEGVKQILRPKKEDSECMKVGHFYYCDNCSKPIYDPKNGVIVHGNIYVADPTMRGGLVGNNFPNVKPGTKIEVTDVKETVLCLNCINSIFKNITSVNKELAVEAAIEDWHDRDLPYDVSRAEMTSDYLEALEDLNSNHSYRSADDLESLLNSDELEPAVPDFDLGYTLPDGSPTF